MGCNEIQTAISQYIDDDLSSTARATVDAHLNVCPVCRAELGSMRDLRSSLRQISRPVAPASLVSSINDALVIEAAARRQLPVTTFQNQLLAWLQPRVMPYSVGSLASVLLFTAMLFALRPHFVALHEAAQSQSVLVVKSGGYNLNQPVTPEDYSALRAPYAEQSPSLNPGGALATLTGNYAQPRVGQDGDDMVVVADVFSNGAASLADVVQAPRDRQMLADFEVALRQNAAFVPASLDRRPDTMRVVFTVQKVDVRDRSF